MDDYAGTKICSVEAMMNIGEEVQRFTLREVVYQINGTLPGISPQAIADSFAQLTQHISSKCGAKFFRTDEKPGKPPNIIATFGTIDAAGNTLAWSQLRQSEQWQVQQKYDTQESWVVAENPPPNKVSFGLVALHESIHSLGAPHLSGGVAVMNPIYNPALKTLQPLDISWLVTAYGEPTTEGPLPPPLDELLLGNLYVDQGGFLKLRRV